MSESKEIQFAEFRDQVRSAVLSALDSEVSELIGDKTVLGAMDNDLSALFSGLDAHVHRLAERINAAQKGVVILAV